MANPAGGLENVWCVIGDDIDAVELRKTLGGHCDKDSSTITPEHFGVRAFALLTLKKDAHLDFTVLIARLGIMDITTTIEIGNDNHALFVMIVI